MGELPRVLLVVGPSTGGRGQHVADLARRLSELGCAVTVWTAPLTAATFDFPQVRTGWPSRRDWRGLTQLRALTGAADVVHAHGEQAGLLCAAAQYGVTAPTPLIISRHNAQLPRPGAAGRLRDTLARRAQRVTYRRATLVTGASADLAQQASQLGAAAVDLVHVPSPRVAQLLLADASAAARAARKKHLGVTGPLVLCIARIDPQKRLDRLVEAAAEAPGQWMIIGSGSAEQVADLQACVARTGAPVRLLGALPDPQEWLLAADLLVLTSQWEARALVVQEAMAAGLPVIAATTPGLVELLGETAHSADAVTGWTTRPGVLDTAHPQLDSAAPNCPAGVLVSQTDCAPQVALAVRLLLANPTYASCIAGSSRARAATWPTADQAARQWLERYLALLR